MKKYSGAVRVSLLLLTVFLLGSCQKSKDTTPVYYNLTTVYENPLPDPVTIQYLNGTIDAKGDTTILYEFDKITIDPNSSTQIMQAICVKGCPEPGTMVPNMARITIGSQQRTDVDRKYILSHDPDPTINDTINIFNEKQWSVSKMNSGDMIRIYKLTQDDYLRTK
ncbi:hypothetical protein A8C56_15440 [Niabella ginsenosidivorans]|uniref:Lipoprotein n=1 Tax=Niabella ginsenosidivorans TaxID=1176587 RepID=A0A1A9I3H6_9BACT|nr:hypothetical protein [Niabella ginsenosidivorans]ANH82176.1 hypothetical protein A8C56_15440 [Niabella ginsenosidivorans]